MVILYTHIPDLWYDNLHLPSWTNEKVDTQFSAHDAFLESTNWDVEMLSNSIKKNQKQPVTICIIICFSTNSI
jgi:hypothetical protein